MTCGSCRQWSRSVKGAAVIFIGNVLLGLAEHVMLGYQILVVVETDSWFVVACVYITIARHALWSSDTSRDHTRCLVITRHVLSSQPCRDITRHVLRSHGIFCSHITTCIMAKQHVWRNLYCEQQHVLSSLDMSCNHGTCHLELI